MSAKTRYALADLPADAIAGFTLWAVFCAQGLAYGRLAHATPAAGLATGVAGALLYALLGSSRRISIGPAGGIAAIVGTAVAAVPPAQLALSLLLLTLMVAAVQLLAGLLDASFLTRLFPTPVFVGYIAGTGVTILIGQARDLVSHGWFAFAIGAAAAVAVVVLRRLWPRLPGPFVVLVVATAVSALFGFGGRGVPVIGDSFGHFGVVGMPHGLTWHSVLALVGPALSLGLVSYVDAQANASMLRERADPPVHPRREFFALAAVNAGSALFGGFVAGCSTSRSLVGIRAGERSRLAPALAGVLLVLTGLSVVSLLRPMPLAALAGVVFVAAFDLIDTKRLREFWRLRRPDFLAAAVAGGAVIGFGMIKGVLIGVLAALAEVFYRGMRPTRTLFAPAGERLYQPFSADAVHAAGEPLVYRFGTPLFFANAQVLLADMQLVAEHAGPALHTVVIDADTLAVPDATARDSLLEAQRELADKGIRLVLGNVRAPVRKALEKTGAFTLLSEAEFLADLRRIRGPGAQRGGPIDHAPHSGVKDGP